MAKLSERELLQAIQQDNSKGHEFLKKSMECFKKRDHLQGQRLYGIYLGYAEKAYSNMTILVTEDEPEEVIEEEITKED